MTPVAVVAFYKFVPLSDLAALRQGLLTLCDACGIKGTVLLAPEGINATLAGEPASVDAAVTALTRGPLFGGRIADVPVKRSTAVAMPFGRLKVRLKREIVTLGDDTAAPAARTGTYVEPDA